MDHPRSGKLYTEKSPQEHVIYRRRPPLSALTSICNHVWALRSISSLDVPDITRDVSRTLGNSTLQRPFTPHSEMAHLNDGDEIQNLISQNFPEPELLANHPPGTQAYWEQQQQQQRQQRQQQQQQQQQSTSNLSRQTSLPRQRSLYHPTPQYVAQPWMESTATLESRMPARYPEDRPLPEQRPFQDLMRVVQDEQAAAALPGTPCQSYGGSQPNVNRL